jgi:hypothetical protein
LVLFPLYAFLVWYACLRWRRQLMGVAALVVGILLILLLAQLDVAIRRALHLADNGPLFRFMLYAEGGMVGMVGALLVLLPPRRNAHTPCRSCGYELLGLDDVNPTCPECGMTFAATKVELAPCIICGQAALAAPDGRNLCKACVPPASIPAA